ncbi:MAG: hypothetical protein ACOH2H_16240 [Cypionkella sp.]
MKTPEIVDTLAVRMFDAITVDAKSFAASLVAAVGKYPNADVILEDALIITSELQVALALMGKKAR